MRRLNVGGGMMALMMERRFLDGFVIRGYVCFGVGEAI